MTKSSPKIYFKDEVSVGNLVSAREFLTLVYNLATVDRLIKQFEHGHPQGFFARDILRAAGLPTLSNEKVASQLYEMSKGDKLNPVLVVVDASDLFKTSVADGYHRLSAAHLLSEHARVKAVVINL